MVKIRLKRIGRKKAPFYRIVVADARTSNANSRVIEQIGTYDPMKDPTEINLDQEAAKKWIGYGAQPTETVAKILKKYEII